MQIGSLKLKLSRVPFFVVRSAQKENSPAALQLTAGLTAAAATNMLMPLAAAAEVTPSLR